MRHAAGAAEEVPPDGDGRHVMVQIAEARIDDTRRRLLADTSRTRFHPELREHLPSLGRPGFQIIGVRPSASTAEAISRMNPFGSWICTSSEPIWRIGQSCFGISSQNSASSFFRMGNARLSPMPKPNALLKEPLQNAPTPPRTRTSPDFSDGILDFQRLNEPLTAVFEGAWRWVGRPVLMRPRGAVASGVRAGRGKGWRA